jgi:S-DNA-T family DNA segregation ATPase FtsK/SpoIIIE
VTILPPPAQPPKKAEQELFPFMRNEGAFSLPALDLLNDPPQQKDADVHRESLEMNAKRLEKKLADFGVEGEVVEILPGPVITMYEYKPAPGVKISKVAGLSDDLALAFRAPSIRIVAPIPGKAAIGIEIPNNQRELVYLKEILSSAAYLETTDRLPIALGKDITGTPVVTDLARMPHLLVAGATGSGKSVSINTIINSLLFKVSPEMVRFLLIDPKRIELSIYQDIPHLLHPVVTQPKEATRALRWAVDEMERRYMLLSDRGARNIETYNKKVLKEQRPPATGNSPQEAHGILPYIILVIDELADLMMTSSRDVEESITRLAQMARAAGIHLVIATQRPSVDVLTGIIKANFPARISFQVSSRVDSRTILDAIGAEQLLGQGDMLFMPPGVGRITRIHGAYVSEEEIKRVTDFLRTQKKPEYDPTVMEQVARDEEQEEGDLERDEKYEEAINVVIQTGQASISMLQRKLRVGYNRAARMIELMEMEGIVGPSDGVRPREVRGRR